MRSGPPWPWRDHLTALPSGAISRRRPPRLEVCSYKEKSVVFRNDDKAASLAVSDHSAVVGNWEGTELIFKCPFQECGRHFIGLYGWGGGHARSKLRTLRPSLPQLSTFPEMIDRLSPDFLRIYAQAEQARHHRLEQVAGPGFRKAFEFLVKDYAKSVSDSSEHAKIEKSFSGNVVDERPSRHADSLARVWSD